MTEAELFTGIDGPRFKRQRALLSFIADNFGGMSDQEQEDLEGLQALLDAIADVAHDHYGKDCLFTED